MRFVEVLGAILAGCDSCKWMGVYRMSRADWLYVKAHGWNCSTCHTPIRQLDRPEVIAAYEFGGVEAVRSIPY